MALTREEVEHVAQLAHVGMSEQDIERFRVQLSEIVDYFDVLKRIDTEGVPPTSQALPLANVTRTDQPHPSLTQDQALANAPLRVDGFFRVRKVLE